MLIVGIIIFWRMLYRTDNVMLQCDFREVI